MRQKRIPFTLAIEVYDLIGPRPHVVPVIDMRIHFENKPRCSGPRRAVVIPGELGTDYGVIFSSLPAVFTQSEVYRLCGRVLVARTLLTAAVQTLYHQTTRGTAQ